ncbi:hypothetical protein K469DRAFT_217548 [Zopfia rhizophila CBS 207.26]|uniref:Uncharacterized protein n=1 Tax=Zopfia rhizophila CBS 207.26 TaxID=1314779 RepID=A0A6A6DX47_9PEZI|nr:hypothetical protein K469DRAFT_217548 [Zopfia rhizophila CBS 207.26]
MTLRGQTEALLHGSKDCSAHARNRWLFDRATAVSPNMHSLSTFVCACNDGVLPVTLSPIAEAGFDLGAPYHASLCRPLLCPLCLRPTHPLHLI